MAIVGKNRSKTKSRSRRARPAKSRCVYRSEITTGTVGCQTCGNKTVERATYWCALHTVDVLTHPYRTDFRACSKCPNYEASE